jgi:hypothetical protein
MTKTVAEIEKLFIPHLREGEELRWIGDNRMLSKVSRAGKGFIFIGFVIVAIFMLLVSCGWIAIGRPLNACMIFLNVLVIVSTTVLSFTRSDTEVTQRLTPTVYYAISNQRILSLANYKLQDFRLLLIADAVVDKPKNGLSTIKIYNNSNPTGQLPKPIFELKGIAEDEAQKAYDILRQAREEALEDRAREMGIE